MKDKKKKSGKNGSFYIALCGCAVVVTLMSYVGNVMRGAKQSPQMQDIAFEDMEKISESFEKEIFPTEEKNPEPEIIAIEPKDREPTEEIEIFPEKIEEIKMTAAKEEVDEFLPALPVSGKVLADFSGENLVFYEKLGDWRTHSGIDIEAAAGDNVYACESGVIEKIYTNNLGGCILIDHQNGYKSLYANLGETNAVKAGDKIDAGAVIGQVGQTAVGDLTTEAHVHFELHHEGKPINPLDVITIE